MLYLAGFVLATAALCYGAYRLGMHSDVLALALAPALLFGAWRLLAGLAVPLAPGSGAGAAVFRAGAWYLGGLCLVLAMLLLGGSYWARRSRVVGAISLFLVFPAVLLLGYRLYGSGAPRSTPVAQPAADPYVEGYTWAVDHGITNEADCVSDVAAFLDGCRKAARAHRP